MGRGCGSVGRVVASDTMSAVRIQSSAKLYKEHIHCQLWKRGRMGAAIAQWIRLRLPFATPGSSPKHSIYGFIKLLNGLMWKGRK